MGVVFMDPCWARGKEGAEEGLRTVCVLVVPPSKDAGLQLPEEHFQALMGSGTTCPQQV